eukprot:Mrub_01600.p1 GENE.Mrub_01600~~Mrub_01600.p1  ORF type:complete len:398 (-),score=106.22 Mrub_01600:142-1335(-)
MKENSCQICKLFFKEKYTKKSLVKTAMKVSEYYKCDINMRESLVSILLRNSIYNPCDRPYNKWQSMVLNCSLDYFETDNIQTILFVYVGDYVDSLQWYNIMMQLGYLNEKRIYVACREEKDINGIIDSLTKGQLYKSKLSKQLSNEYDEQLNSSHNHNHANDSFVNNVVQTDDGLMPMTINSNYELKEFNNTAYSSNKYNSNPQEDNSTNPNTITNSTSINNNNNNNISSSNLTSPSPPEVKYYITHKSTSGMVCHPAISNYQVISEPCHPSAINQQNPLVSAQFMPSPGNEARVVEYPDLQAALEQVHSLESRMQLNCTPTDLDKLRIVDMHDNEHHINTYIAYMSDNYFKFNTFNVEEEMNMKINKLHSHLYGVQELIILNIMDTLFTMKGNHKN